MQHVLNRGDHRETLFHKPADFRAFLGVVAETASRIAMRILAYCIMGNHFHFVVWPYEGADLPLFMHLLMTTHIGRYLRHYPPVSPGHLYQDRYTNVLVETGPSLLRVLRYVEANALTAEIVERAEDYPWTSASPEALEDGRPIIAEWPIEKPSNWPALLNLRTAAQERKRIQRCAARGAPYGSPAWTERVIKQFSLEHTMRRPGRPKRDESIFPAGDLPTPT
ncbi:MAG TPA: transposase [Vicinamibacterales bacterium]|nr:transposase [Vicinamibacterales bacterium]